MSSKLFARRISRYLAKFINWNGQAGKKQRKSDLRLETLENRWVPAFSISLGNAVPIAPPSGDAVALTYGTDGWMSVPVTVTRGASTDATNVYLRVTTASTTFNNTFSTYFSTIDPNPQTNPAGSAAVSNTFDPEKPGQIKYGPDNQISQNSLLTFTGTGSQSTQTAYMWVSQKNFNEFTRVLSTGASYSVEALAKNSSNVWASVGTSSGKTLNINKQSITAIVSIENKEYDGTDAANISTRRLDGFKTGDPSQINPNQPTVSLSGGVASFIDKNRGQGRTVNVTGLALSGTDAINYRLASTSVSSTADIAARQLYVNLDALQRVYDGTDHVSFADGQYDPITHAVSPAQVNGVVDSESVVVRLSNVALDSKHAGLRTVVFNAALESGDNGITDQSNYDLLPNNVQISNALVDPRPISFTFSAEDKVFDGTEIATFDPASIQAIPETDTDRGLVGKDTVVLDMNAYFVGRDVLWNTKVQPQVPAAMTVYGEMKSLLINSDPANSDYVLDYIDSTLATISPRQLTITPNSLTGSNKLIYGQGKVFGTSPSNVTYSELGSGDEITAVQVRFGNDSGFDIAANAPAGSYAGSLSIVEGPIFGNKLFRLENYTVVLGNGDVEIAKANAVVTANSASGTYSGESQSVTGFTASGLVNGETETVLSGLAESGGVGTAAGKYAHSYTVGSYDGNYNLSFVAGSLEIAKANLQAIAQNKFKVYDGTPFTAFTVGFRGLVNGENGSVVSGQDGVKFGGTAIGASNYGTYTITLANIESLSADNYNIELASSPDGVLTIGQEVLKVRLKEGLQKTYGDTYTFSTSDFIFENLAQGVRVDDIGAFSVGSGARAGVDSYAVNIAAFQ